jgi:hypothetical protein
MGANTLPYVVRRLRHDDLKSWQVYWNLRHKLPVPLQSIMPRPEFAPDVMGSLMRPKICILKQPRK